MIVGILVSFLDILIISLRLSIRIFLNDKLSYAILYKIFLWRAKYRIKYNFHNFIFRNFTWRIERLALFFKDYNVHQVYKVELNDVTMKSKHNEISRARDYM